MCPHLDVPLSNHGGIEPPWPDSLTHLQNPRPLHTLRAYNFLPPLEAVPPELLMVPPELLFTMGVPEPPELLLVKTVPAPELLFVTDPAGEGAGAGTGPALQQIRAKPSQRHLQTKLTGSS